jgi:hypothetical protein
MREAASYPGRIVARLPHHCYIVDVGGVLHVGENIGTAYDAWGECVVALAAQEALKALGGAKRHGNVIDAYPETYWSLA